MVVFLCCADLANLVFFCNFLSSDSELWWSAVSTQQSDPGCRIVHDGGSPSYSSVFPVPTACRHSLRLFLSTTSTALFGRSFCRALLLSWICLAATTWIRVSGMLPSLPLDVLVFNSQFLYLYIWIKIRFVPVALADSYSAYALAAPSPFVGSTNAELAHYLHRYQTLGPPPCSPLTRYLPTASPCGLGPDWRLARDSSRSVVELPSSSSMHDDRNPLPLAATEATASGSGNSSSVGGVSGTPANGNNTCPKVEAGSTASSAHPSTMLAPPSSTRSFFPFAGGAPMVGSAAAATAYASRCLNANCSCSGQSSPTCPKNALAGPLTGTAMKEAYYE